jgi:hypothetical protein
MISSAIDLYDSRIHFLIPNHHNDFAMTGLKRTSYVLGDEFKEIKITDLKKCKRIGEISGELAIEFDNWLG